MNPDISIIHYTANREKEEFLARVRGHLLLTAGDIRIVSISQKPLEFGDNICVGEIGASLHSLFWQALVGARAVTTKFVICAEDDFLYTPEHFAFRPPKENVFYYDTNRWTVDHVGRFSYRERTSFGMCIATTQALIDTLENRFAKYPVQGHKKEMYFSEPGKYEGPLGIPLVKMERMALDTPSITFNHRESLGKVRMVRASHPVVYFLPPWGIGKNIWKEFME